MTGYTQVVELDAFQYRALLTESVRTNRNIEDILVSAVQKYLDQNS